MPRNVRIALGMALALCLAAWYYFLYTTPALRYHGEIFFAPRGDRTDTVYTAGDSTIHVQATADGTTLTLALPVGTHRFTVTQAGDHATVTGKDGSTVFDRAYRADPIYRALHARSAHATLAQPPTAADAFDLARAYPTATRGTGRALPWVFCAVVFTLFVQQRLDGGMPWESPKKETRIPCAADANPAPSREAHKTPILVSVSWLLCALVCAGALIYDVWHY